MEALVHVAENVSTTKRRQFQVRMNRAQQVATTWSAADRPKAIECLEHEIHQVTPVKCKLFDEIFHHLAQQLLQEDGSKATSPRSRFTKQLALLKTAAKAEAYGAANMYADKRLQFQNHRSNAETEVTTWSLAGTERVTDQQETEIFGITSNEQKWFKEEFSIRLIEFEAW